jgi:hypothetical protein
MAITYTPSPALIDETITLAISGATGNTDATQFTLTSVPDRSALETGLIVDENGDPTNEIVFDVPGSYGIHSHDFIRYTGIPAFPGDVAGTPRDVLVATQTGTVYVGATADLPIITTRGDGATLRLVLSDTLVMSAELVDPTTEIARVTCLATTVVAALAALVDVAVTALDVDFVTDVNALCTAFAAHIVLEGAGPVHAAADTTNTMRREPANSVDAAIVRLNDLFDRMDGHFQSRSSGGTWHVTDDGKNVPVTAPATSLAGATVLKADLRERCYERHRVLVSTPAVHGAADNTNTMAAPLPLAAFIVAFLDELVNATPTSPAGEQEGAVDIGRLLGFKVTT